MSVKVIHDFIEKEKVIKSFFCVDNSKLYNYEINTQKMVL